MFDKLKRMLREKKVFIPLIIALVILMAVGTWWFISAHRPDSPEDIVEKSDKLISVEIAKNFKKEIELDDFMKLLNDNKVERVYYQNKKKEYGSVVLYYIKLRGEEGYYINEAPPGTGYALETPLGLTTVSLNDYLGDISGKLGKSIDFKLLSATPKLPFPKEQIYITIGVIIFFGLILYFIFWRGILRGSGGFGKAKTQDIKKPVYFEDVGGIEEVLEESREVVRMIRGED